MNEIIFSTIVLNGSFEDIYFNYLTIYINHGGVKTSTVLNIFCHVDRHKTLSSSLIILWSTNFVNLKNIDSE